MSSTMHPDYPYGSAFPWAEDASDRSNAGLKVKYHHEQLGHKHWGFVIYRCTYNDDAAWKTFINMFNKNARRSCEYYGTEELLQTLDWNVQDNKALFNGASKNFVRRHFAEWVKSHPASEYSRLDAAPFAFDQTPRTTYCVHVDEAALRSVVGVAPKSPELGSEGVGYVNLVRATWALPDPADHDAEAAGYDDVFDEGEAPVEGCRLYDVGWMKVRSRGLVLDTYARLLNGDWELSYVRPPEVAVH